MSEDEVVADLQRRRDAEAYRIQTILDTGEALMIEARQTLAELDRMLADVSEHA